MKWAFNYTNWVIGFFKLGKWQFFQKTFLKFNFKSNSSFLNSSINSQLGEKSKHISDILPSPLPNKTTFEGQGACDALVTVLIRTTHSSHKVLK